MATIEWKLFKKSRILFVGYTISLFSYLNDFFFVSYVYYSVIKFKRLLYNLVNYMPFVKNKPIFYKKKNARA